METYSGSLALIWLCHFVEAGFFSWAGYLVYKRRYLAGLSLFLLTLIVAGLGQGCFFDWEVRESPRLCVGWIILLGVATSIGLLAFRRGRMALSVFLVAIAWYLTEWLIGMVR